MPLLYCPRICLSQRSLLYRNYRAMFPCVNYYTTASWSPHARSVRREIVRCPQWNHISFSSSLNIATTTSAFKCSSQYRSFSSSPAVQNETAGTDTVTTISPSSDTATLGTINSPTSELLETSATAQWATDAAEISTAGDLSSLGLGGYTPIGLIQSSLEWFHVHAGLPWWASIVVCTVLLRTTLLPIAINVQANAARLNNIRPATEKLMAKIKHHNRFKQHNLSAVANKKLLDLYREHKCSPFKLMLTPFIQIPIFISFFIGLRRMAAAPVESMKSGGALWFSDLTVPDPYYVLPFLSCGFLLATIEMGGEAGVTNPQLEKMKTFFRAFTILLIPITAQFPTGLFMYWLPSSLFSIIQILFLKIPGVRSKLGIPDIVTTPGQASQNSKGLLEMIKENYRSAVVDNEAKAKKEAAEKRYKKLLKDKSPKLYDKPPHLRK